MTLYRSTDSSIPVSWQPLLRGVWLVGVLLLIAGFLAGLPYRYSELATTCSGACPALSLTSAEVAILQSYGLSLSFYASLQMGLEIPLALVYVALALLIFWRLSHTWTGLSVSFVFVALGLTFWNEEIRSLVRVYPALTRPGEVATAIAILSSVLIFYIFPDGRFVPGWTRPLFFLLGSVVLVDAIAPFSLARASSSSLVAMVGWLGCAAVGFFSQIYRYRRVSSRIQRQQTKWVTFGFVSMFAVALPWAILVELVPLAPGPVRVLFNLSVLLQNVVICFFPITVAIAILRYRLWDVDLVIRRTLQYALLTGLLALTYFGSIVLLQTIFGTFTGAQSPVVIVLSTLLIAALFTSLRRRVQEVIDRRFFRQKYDAQQVLAAFAVTARDETDLDSLTVELARVVEGTMQPEGVGVWLMDTAPDQGRR